MQRPGQDVVGDGARGEAVHVPVGGIEEGLPGSEAVGCLADCVPEFSNGRSDCATSTPCDVWHFLVDRFGLREEFEQVFAHDSAPAIERACSAAASSRISRIRSGLAAITGAGGVYFGG